MYTKTYEQKVETFWKHVDRSGGDNACWPWTSWMNSKGYGKFKLCGWHSSAHRIAYAVTHGEIPEGYDIDHICNNRACCNPSHLQAISHRENVLRSENTIAGRQSRQTHCKRGHPLSGDNLLMEGNKRFCRECKRLARPDELARRKQRRMGALNG